MFRIIVYIAFILSVLSAAAYAGFTCAKPPSNNQYYLTDFCGSTSACGQVPSCSGTHYFTADAQRFGCSKYLNLCNSSKKCVKAQIYDSGPAMWVEQDAGRAIIDASPTICQLLSGHSSCGWSDKISITATLTSALDGRPLGPFNVTNEEYEDMLVTHEILLEQCEADGVCKVQE
ncbi:lysozyme [Cavenderia fasciculata]|uniref:Lysozyme n=1 Tax=Cavenderia fasciculata TaxID=261658 RepID=F4PN47_CACFS|nr:lysozyme [Cavenderia fasciculata]EGG23737.1 lysozyme [Cavenderia fasciculata]|eukprot:XP_004361588.1 lysozyme [Cavenderia fasciculata]